MFKEFAEQYYEEARAIREDLHRHPELSYNEYRTAELIEGKLREYGVDSMERMFDTGVIALIHGAQACALLDNRDFVLPEDVQHMLLPVFAHRMVLSPEARMKGVVPDNVLLKILQNTSVPMKL